jgi:hypothetical protein
MPAQQQASWFDPVQSTLGWTLPDSIWIDFARTVVIIVAFHVTLMQLRVGWGKGRPFDRALRQGLSAFIILNLVAVLTEMQQLGQPFVPWRLQVMRFGRLTVLASVPVLIEGVKGGKFDWRVLLAYTAPVAETAWRQVFPALGAKAADSAPGVTIVPDQAQDTPQD